jgi:hypothetical protein
VNDDGFVDLSDALGHLRLTAEGGHPGPDAAHCAIRRWAAPEDGVITVQSLLTHTSREEDGIGARIISSRSEELATFRAHHRTVEANLIEVRRGGLCPWLS